MPETSLLLTYTHTHTHRTLSIDTLILNRSLILLREGGARVCVSQVVSRGAHRSSTPPPWRGRKWLRHGSVMIA